MADKRRITVTVDQDVLDAAAQLVRQGAEDSVSGWVNRVLHAEVERQRGLQHLRDAVADYEREFGELTTRELDAQARADHTAATNARPSARRARSA